MKTVISWWNLDASNQTIASLRQHLEREGVDPWRVIQGLKCKLWISDDTNNLWGAVMLWESPEFMSQPLPPNRATELIGYPPTVRLTFDVDATVEGVLCPPMLNFR